MEFDRLERMATCEARSSMADENILLLINCIQSLLLEYEQDLKLVPFDPIRWNGKATDALIHRRGNFSKQACENSTSKHAKME